MNLYKITGISLIVVKSLKSRMYFTILALSLVLLSVSSERINITNEHDLENFLCNETRSLDDDDILLVLSNNITHLISNNVSFCVTNDTNSLTLISESSKQVVIKCNDSSTLPNSGFAFTNIHNLTLIRLVFTGCGERLKRLAAMESINSSASPMYFSQYHSAVLVFLHINTLFIDKVIITNHHGFAVLAINPMNALINNCSITSGKHASYRKDFGSGVFLLFTDIIGVPLSDDCSVTIQHSTLSKNFDYYYSNTNSICDTYQKHNQEYFPIFNAAGLSVFYLQRKFATKVWVMQSSFISNHGILAGAVLVIYYNSVKQSQVTISNSTFIDNFSNNNCPGSDLLFIFHEAKQQHYSDQLFPLYVFSTNFSGHGSAIGNSQGIIYLYIYNPSKMINMTLTFSHVNFTSISTRGSGACLHAVSDISDDNFSSGQIILTDITAMEINQRNSLYSRDYQKGIFVIENFDYIFLNGSSIYSKNFLSVFDILNTKVVLGGQLLFENNTGNSGSAFMLTGFSRFILQDGLNATFIHNVAFENGGAIYAYNSVTSECMFTPTDLGINTMLLKFINNSATNSGNSIFSNNLYNCSQMQNFNVSVAKKFYQDLSHHTLFNETDDQQVSTVAFKQKICSNDSSNFMNRSNAIVVYPGMMLHFSMAVLDAFNQPTGSDVLLNLIDFDTLQMRNFPSKNWCITPNIITLSPKNCTMINVTIFKRIEKDDPFWIILLLSVSKVLSITNLFSKDCPIGFKFNNSTHKCECSYVLHKIDNQPVCKISSDGSNPLITINLVTSFVTHSNWIGTLDNGTVFGVSPYCHIYCRYNDNYDTFVINDSVGSTKVMIAHSSNYDNKESLCSDNREGLLCSQCTPGYSVTFGSIQCEKCSNWWLLTLIVYGLAGASLIYLLYALNLTLTTGKLNGIIFYSQILYNVHTLTLTRYQNTVNGGLVKFFFFCLRGVLLLINLNISFNIPLCFYDGMTELWKSGLGLLFPVYLLSIVIGLIIISRYSVRLSNRIANSSIQVLVTVVHLSFSTLLTSLFDVFTPVYIYTNTSDAPLVVWQNDSTVEYGKGGHLILMIVTGLVVGPILTTYITVLLAGRPLMKINRIREYLRPIYEAIHAPYKPNKEFLFSFSIIFIALTYLITAVFTGTNPHFGIAVGVAVTCLYMNIVGFSHPFKSMHLNILNTVIYSVIIILSCSFWSVIVGSTVSIKWAILVTFCHLIIVIILLCVIISQFSFGKKLFNKITSFRVNNLKFDRRLVRQRNLDECDSFYQSCNEREPLLN